MRQDSSGCRKTSIVIKNGCLALLALLVLHRAKLLASNQSILALGVAPRRVAGTPVPVFPPRHGCRACMHKGFARCKANQAYTAFHGGKGIGIINQKFISKTDFFCKLKRALPCGKTLLLFTLNTICN